MNLYPFLSVKLSLCRNSGIWGGGVCGVEAKFHSFSTSVLDEGQRSASCSSRFVPEKKVPVLPEWKPGYPGQGPNLGPPE